MRTEHPGVALIICSPSGGGKSTLIDRLIKEFPGFCFSISYTTRKPRPGEEHGRDYFFVDPEEFEALVEKHFFAEWATVHGKSYGTPLQPVLDTLAAGRDMLFDIDIQGARQLQARILQSVSVFILPPSRQILEQRLDARGSEDRQTRERRLRKAYEEIQAAPEFTYWVLNQDLQTASHRLKAIYLAEKCRSSRNREMLPEVLTTWNRTT